MNNLLYCAKKGYINTIRSLLKENINVNEQDEFMTTALMFASENGDIEIVQDLLKSGANPNLTDNTKNTALIYACQNGYCNIVRELINYGADINHQNYDGLTGFICACSNGYIEIVNELLKCQETNINLQDKHKKTGMIYACINYSKKYKTIIYNILDDKRFEPKKNYMTLLFAIDNEDTYVVKKLFECGLKLNTITENKIFNVNTNYISINMLKLICHYVDKVPSDIVEKYNLYKFIIINKLKVKNMYNIKYEKAYNELLNEKKIIDSEPRINDCSQIIQKFLY